MPVKGSRGSEVDDPHPGVSGRSGPLCTGWMYLPFWRYVITCCYFNLYSSALPASLVQWFYDVYSNKKPTAEKVKRNARSNVTCEPIYVRTIKGGSRRAEKSRKVLMMMKAAKLGWAGAGAEKKQSWSKSRARKGRSRAGQEQGRSRNWTGVG